MIVFVNSFFVLRLSSTVALGDILGVDNDWKRRSVLT